VISSDDIHRAELRRRPRHHRGGGSGIESVGDDVETGTPSAQTSALHVSAEVRARPVSPLGGSGTGWTGQQAQDVAGNRSEAFAQRGLVRSRSAHR
jgi:hypothetical protein